MKPLTVSLLLFVPFALGARYYFVCETLRWCDRDYAAATTSAGAEPARTTSLALPDGATLTLALGALPGTSLAPPRSRATEAALDSLASALQRYPEHDLRIAGPLPADAGARAHDYFDDLGIARAADLGARLQRRGIAGERLDLASYEPAAHEAPVLRLGLGLPRSAAPAAALPSGEHLLDSTALLGLRFATNSTALSPTPEFRAYATELVGALAARPELTLTLTGHTDDRAAAAFNDSLGLWRARAVARYLEQLGYAREIRVRTAGEREPVAPNATPEGRYRNRRVAVRID